MKIILSIALFHLLISFVNAQDTAPLEKLIRDAVTAQQEFRSDDLAKLLTADYVEVSPVGEVDERAKVLEFYKPSAKPPANAPKVETNVTDFRHRFIRKDLAIVVVRLDYTITAPGRPAMKRSLRATYVCTKLKNRWLISGAQFTGIPK